MKSEVKCMRPRVRLLRVNREKRYSGMVIEKHSHGWYEFVYYINAEGRVIINETESKIKSGRFSVIRPLTQHSERHYIDGVVFFCIFECDTELEERLYDDTDETVLRLCNSIAEEFFSPREYSGELLELLLSELILRYLRWQADDSKTVRDISYAAEFIERRFRERIDLRSLASDVGYGYDYFHHLFKKKYGLSPKQYQMDCRMRYAKQLLMSGRYSCTEVAYLSGYSDSAQFSLIFKRECGVSPSRYAEDEKLNFC